MMNAFCFETGTWRVKWPERVSQHDIVCLSPPLDPMQGLPLGNGDLGALVWCEPRRLVLAVNKCDLWDDSPDTESGGFNEDAPYWEDRWTALRHACRLEVDLALPFMDTGYLQEFEARLDLARARVVIHSATPFGTFDARIFISAADKALALSFDIQAIERIAPRVTIERWGSRTFAHWYSQVSRDVSIGLSGTEVLADGSDLVLRQQLRTLRFAVAARAQIKGRDIPPRRLHSRAGQFEPTPADRHSGQVLLAVVNSEEVAEPEGEATRRVVAAQKKGPAAMENEHSRSWREFWERCYVRLDDKFLENLWHLTIYYAGCSQRGRYPGLFTEALWAWNRDFQQWCHYHHWNQQQLTWPLPSANHPELMKPYLNYRFSMLGKAKETAARVGKTGAFYTDVSDRSGHQWIDRNRTPGGQIVADFWRYFAYSGDVELLREQGWPVIREVARWHYSLLEKKSDGLYHTTPGWGYEGGNMLRDGTTDLVTTRRVFVIALAAAGVLGITIPELAVWKEALDKLAPVVTMESPVHPGTEIFAAGLQKGFEPGAGLDFCDGFTEGDEKEWQNPQPTCKHDPKVWGQIFSGVETSVIFPAGCVGLKDRGTREFELAMATVREANMHWTKRIVYARMGMRKELQAELAALDGNWTPTGFSAFIPGFWDVNQVADPLLAPKNYAHKDVKGPEWAAFMNSRIPFRAWECRLIQQEGSYLITTAISESLLQSYDGVIRVAPATAPDSPFAFTLLAQGGFVVSAQGQGETVDWIHIRSLRGEPCRVSNPWVRGALHLHRIGSDGWEKRPGAEVAFDTAADATYLLAPEPRDAAALRAVEDAPPRAEGPRQSADGKVTLGIPRMF